MSDISDLFDAAKKMMQVAHAPYSCFHVGAAVRAQSGNIYAGANVENAAYPEGWCAETSAIAALVAGGEQRIIEVCILADSDKLVTPCGGCRQRLAEFGGADMVIHVGTSAGIKRRFTLGELLPETFYLEGDI